MRYQSGDRVRIIKPSSAYTGCRGTIAPAEGPVDPALTPLGYHVAIDGENGVARAFLVAELTPLTVARVQPIASDARQESSSTG